MANTIETDDLFIVISAMDEDYLLGGKNKIHSIKFFPGAANDVVVILSGSATGPQVCRLESGDGEPRIEYFDGNRFNPYIDFDASTLSTGHKIVITLCDD